MIAVNILATASLPEVGNVGKHRAAVLRELFLAKSASARKFSLSTPENLAVGWRFEQGVRLAEQVPLRTDSDRSGEARLVASAAINTTPEFPGNEVKSQLSLNFLMAHGALRRRWRLGFRPGLKDLIVTTGARPMERLLVGHRYDRGRVLAFDFRYRRP